MLHPSNHADDTWHKAHVSDDRNCNRFVLTCTHVQTQSRILTPPSLPMHWQTLHFTLILPLYHPHRDKSSLPQHVKPSLIWTVSLPSRVLFLIFSSPGWQQTYRTTFLQLWVYIGVSHAHTHTETPDRNHNILLFFLFFSPFGNCRVNIFINHITWHDAPKFLLCLQEYTE